MVNLSNFSRAPPARDNQIPLHYMALKLDLDRTWSVFAVLTLKMLFILHEYKYLSSLFMVNDGRIC